MTTDEKPVAAAAPAPAQKDDLQARMEGFNAKLIPILKEFELGLSAEAFIEKGKTLARPIVFNDRKAPETPAAVAPVVDKAPAATPEVPKKADGVTEA